MEQNELDALRILRDALDTDPGERDSYVSMRCGDNAALRDRVDALLRGIAAEDMASVPAHERTNASSATDDTGDDPLAGRLLGPFRVLERIGRGGMGVVYRGSREGGDFDQQVAIKLIRRGFDFDDIRARFLRERRILARLSHPNLARFIDGGVSDDGRPWFALEFVDGQPIDAWCNARRLDIRARIQLLLEVCAAVQYAHTQLIVHRDLKPGNVLIDVTGKVRLLDFGVAGLLAADANDGSTPSTIGVAQAITPEYAAPEQLAGEAVGVSADVYALGVILYELIAGVLPHTFDPRATDAVARARSEPPQALVAAIQRPPRAATGSHAAAASLPTAAAKLAHVLQQRLDTRRTTASAYRRLVRGDLSRIVEKALAAEPSHRYSTVAALADDLGSWLQGNPVLATGVGRGYRLGKFVTRHRAGVAAALIAVVAATALGTYHAVTLNHELQKTQTQRNRAEASLAFMRQLLASPDPQMGAGPDTRLGDFLRSSAVTIERTADLDPALRDELALTIAGSLKSIDRYDEALAIAEPIAKSGASTPSGWITRVGAATLVGEILTLKGEYAAALAQLDIAAALADAHAVTDPLTIATLLSTQSIAHNHLAQWDDSIRQIDRAIDVAKPIADSNPEFFANLIGFASIPRAYPKTDLVKGEALLRKSLAFQRSHGLMSSGLYANTLGELAQTIIDQGRFEEAEPVILESAAQMKERFGPQHRETSFKLSDVALLYFRWNRFDDARRWRDDATQAMRVALGADHPFVALSLIQSADLAFYAGDVTRAAADSATAVPIADPSDLDEFSARARLYAAAQRCDDGHTDAADALLARIVELKDKFGVRAFDVRLAASNCLDRLGRHDEAWTVMEPFARKMASGATLNRNDYIVAWIARVRKRSPGR